MIEAVIYDGTFISHRIFHIGSKLSYKVEALKKDQISSRVEPRLQDRGFNQLCSRDLNKYKHVYKTDLFDEPSRDNNFLSFE